MARPRAGFDSYKDVRPIWSAAATYGGIAHECATHKHAKELIQRLHAFRVLDRKRSFDGVYSIYDDFIVTNPEPTRIVIRRRVVEGTTLTLNGEPIDMDLIHRRLKTDDDINAEQTLRDLGIDTQRVEDRAKKLQIDPDKPLDFEIDQ